MIYFLIYLFWQIEIYLLLALFSTELFPNFLMRSARATLFLMSSSTNPRHG